MFYKSIKHSKSMEEKNTHDFFAQNHWMKIEAK